MQSLFSVSPVLLLQQTIIPNKQPCLKASNRINNEINNGKGQWQDQRISHVALKSIWGRKHGVEQFTEVHGEHAKKTYWLGHEFQARCATFSFTLLQNCEWFWFQYKARFIWHRVLLSIIWACSADSNYGRYYTTLRHLKSNSPQWLVSPALFPLISILDRQRKRYQGEGGV